MKKPPTPPTQQRLAGEIGVKERRLRELFEAGLPRPKKGETLKAWSMRAKAWRQAQAEASPRVGPLSMQGDVRDPEAIAHWVRRDRMARATLRELEVQRARAEVHSVETCDIEKAEALAAMRQTLQGIVVTAARTCANKSEDYILGELSNVMRSAFEELVRRFREANGGVLPRPGEPSRQTNGSPSSHTATEPGPHANGTSPAAAGPTHD